jgi:hypothetical protein
MPLGRSTRRQDQAPVGHARESLDGLLNLRSVAHVDRTYVDPKCLRYGLDGGELTGAGSQTWIAKDRCSGRIRRNLLQKFQPFSAYTEFELSKAGGVAPGRAKLSTRPVPTGSPATGNTIGIVRVTCRNADTGPLP